MIKLLQAIDEDYEWIYHAMCHEKTLKNVFDGRNDRLCCSFANFIIYNDQTKVGFINLVDEQVPGYMFIDMGILPVFQNQGLGTQAMKCLLDMLANLDYILVAETTRNNIKAIYSIQRCGGWFVGEAKDSIFYILNYEKFINMPSDVQEDFYLYLGNKKQR